MRLPLVRRAPADWASAQVVSPVARRNQVAASVSTTAGGVPRVWTGPSTHCTAPKGGTLTSTERPGAASESRVRVQRTAVPVVERSGLSVAAHRARAARPSSSLIRRGMATSSPTPRVRA